MGWPAFSKEETATVTYSQMTPSGMKGLVEGCSGCLLCKGAKAFTEPGMLGHRSITKVAATTRALEPHTAEH